MPLNFLDDCAYETTFCASKNTDLITTNSTFICYVSSKKTRLPHSIEVLIKIKSNNTPALNLDLNHKFQNIFNFKISKTILLVQL